MIAAHCAESEVINTREQEPSQEVDDLRWLCKGWCLPHICQANVTASSSLLPALHSTFEDVQAVCHTHIAFRQIHATAIL